ncbi:MAG: amino acid ABC transporter substrate-binding protein [Clostridia bacterium]|nr:amino acid ABC transporter substrate-binding protein [Clostridia bacterium]
MKRIISILLACLMLVSLFAFAGCRKDDGAATGGTNATVNGDRPTNLAEKHGVKTMKDGKIVIGMEAAYEPFEMIAEDGSFVGYDVDMAYELEELLGVEVEFINTGFDGILDGIDVNYDCVISALTVNDERKEQVLFTDHYIANYQAVVVKKGADVTVESFEDLDGAKISLQEGTTSSDLMESLIEDGTIDASIITNPHVGTCFDSLKNGEVDFVVCDSTVATARLSKTPDDFEIVWVDNANPEVFAIAVGKENTALAAAFNEGIAILKDEGFFEDNDARWFA